MKISVITVVFNAVRTFSDTIQSVKAQTYPDIEYIVVDGASTDGTLDIVACNHRFIHKFVSAPDNGIYDAMNKGLELASGDIIAFLNADDVYSNTRVIEQGVHAIVQNDLDAVFGDAEFINPRNPKRPVRIYRSKKFQPARIARGWMPAHPSLFLHRRVYDRFGKFRTHYHIAGDFEFVARIFYGETLRYQYIPETWVKMRMGGISTGGWRSTLLLNKEILQACRENNIQTNMFKLLSKYPAKLLEFIHL